LVEDERSMRDLLALMLSKEGYRVDTAENGTQAQERIEKENLYDLLITDISMPGMTGLELLAHTRRASPETEVILMTAYGSKETAIQALNAGATYFVEKPFDLEEMKVVVRRTFERRRIAAENADLKNQNRDLQRKLHDKYRFDGLVGRS